MANQKFGKMEEEIYSHSSMLTNRRMDILFQEIDNLNYNAFCEPTIDNLKRYFSACKTIFDRAFTVFSEEENDLLNKVKNAWMKIYFSYNPEEMEEGEATEKALTMYFITEYFDQLIHAYLQKKRYFFRVGERDIKGLEKSVAIMEQGGGIFGKKGLRGLVEEQHKPDGNNSEAVSEND